MLDCVCGTEKHNLTKEKEMSLRINRPVYLVSVLTRHGGELQDEFYSKKSAEKLARSLCKEHKAHTTVFDSEATEIIAGYVNNDKNKPIYEFNYLMEFKYINNKVIRVK